MNSFNPFLATQHPNPEGAAFVPAKLPLEAFEPSVETSAYNMIPSAPAPELQEVELSDVTAVEIFVCWGNSVLHVAHLTPPRDFYVGETLSAAAPCDCSLPSEQLGTPRLPLLLGPASAPSLVIPKDATGFVQVPGQAIRALDAVRAEATPIAEVAGARALPFTSGMRARIELAGFVFRLASVRAGRPAGRGLFAADWSSLPYFGLSFAVHAGLIGVFAFLTPSLGLADEENLDRDRLYVMQQYLDSAAERERKAEPAEAANAPAPEGGQGSRSPGAEGSMGKPTEQAQNKRYAVRGPKDNADIQLPKETALKEAMDFGMIGLLNTIAGDPNTPTASWGRDAALGTDEISKQGRMWGNEIGDAVGAGGLGLTGIGESSGGRGIGIGLDPNGIAIGHGMGGGTKDGFGNSGGLLRGAHGTKTPKVRVAVSTVSGHLPGEVVQRIVRQNFGRFRMCYQQGLSRNPNLEGRVSARFVIGRDGAVSSVSNGGSDLPDSAVTSCVISAFYGLTFPAPESGIVTVVYPILLSPG